MGKMGKVVLATIAGFATGILVAPKSGKETRAELKVKAEKAKVEADKKATQVKQAAKEGAEKVGS